MAEGRTYLFIGHFNIDSLDFFEGVSEIIHPMSPFPFSSASLVSRPLD
jgi:hypothetical protein